MTDERYHQGWADRRAADAGWTLVPGEMIQRAGFDFEARVPIDLEARFGIADASSNSAWLELQRLSGRQWLEASRLGQLPGAPLLRAQPRYWAALAGSRMLIVWPAPDKRYAAAWL